jgi:hypothetical protein
MTKPLTPLQRRVFALIFAAGEARREGSSIRLSGEKLELPSFVVRQLIGKGYLSRTVARKGLTIYRPAILPAATLDNLTRRTAA